MTILLSEVLSMDQYSQVFSIPGIQIPLQLAIHIYTGYQKNIL